MKGTFDEIEALLKQHGEDQETINENGIPLLVASLYEQIDELKALPMNLQDRVREKIALAICDCEGIRAYACSECYIKADRVLALLAQSEEPGDAALERVKTGVTLEYARLDGAREVARKIEDWLHGNGPDIRSVIAPYLIGALATRPAEDGLRDADSAILKAVKVAINGLAKILWDHSGIEEEAFNAILDLKIKVYDAALERGRFDALASSPPAKPAERGMSVPDRPVAPPDGWHYEE
jgi:hypothetical protein